MASITKQPHVKTLEVLPEISRIAELLVDNPQAYYCEDTRQNGRYAVLALEAETSTDFTDRASILELSEKVDSLPRLDSSLPFSGGIAGLLDFELAYHLYNVPHPKQNSYGFAHLITAFAILDKAKGLTHLVDLYGRPLKIESLTEKLLAAEVSTSEANANIEFSNYPQKEFFDKVDSIKSHIVRGDIFQCVIAERATARLESKQQIVQLFANIRNQNQVPYAFFIKHGERAVFGASPEKLVSIDASGKMITHPIAGTRPRGKIQEQDQLFAEELSRCPKEQAEHLMLVDLARNDLGQVCRPHTVQVTDYMSLKKFDKVMHLVSEVQGQIENKISRLEALLSCFPAGTLSGAPKKSALERISRYETQRRSGYGGAAFTLDTRKNLESFITIRSFEAINNSLSISAGAGIVYDSIAKNEYKEIQNKSLSTRLAAHPLSSFKKEIGG